MTVYNADGYTTGLSLSLCVKDIIEGKVDLDRVTMISTGTLFTAREQFRTTAQQNYCRTYWKKDPKRALEIALHLWDQGLLDQPRCRGKDPEPIHDGHWRASR